MQGSLVSPARGALRLTRRLHQAEGRFHNRGRGTSPSPFHDITENFELGTSNLEL